MTLRKFKPWFCVGCGVLVTKEPWRHLDRYLLSGEWRAAALAQIHAAPKAGPEDRWPAETAP